MHVVDRRTCAGRGLSQKPESAGDRNNRKRIGVLTKARDELMWRSIRLAKARGELMRRLAPVRGIGERWMPVLQSAMTQQ